MILWEQCTDTELLAGWFEGEAAAFEAFFSRHAGRVMAYARGRGLGADAEDVVQLVFCRLHRDIHLYDPSRPAMPWFFTIVHRTCVDVLRKRSRTPLVGEVNLDAFASGASEPGDGGHGDVLEAGLASLKPEQRRVVEMRVQDELSFREISRATGKSEVSLRKTFERALTFLRARLSSGEGG